MNKEKSSNHMQISAETAQNYLFRYFELHAAQRMNIFNFYIIFASLLSGGMFKIIETKSSLSSIIGIFAAISLIALSYVFSKLDSRVRFLIQHGERFLKNFERECPFNNQNGNKNLIDIFSEEERETQGLKNGCKGFWKFRYFTYSKCFRWVFAIFSILGFVGIVLSLTNLTVITCLAH